jgi:geranylgeranyl reductase family protein
MSAPYDAIIIGAGPAGSCCAYYCARQNLRVLLLERESLPRHKTCGGAVPRRALESYPFFTDLNASCPPVGLMKVAYSFRGTRFCERTTSDIKVFSVERSSFDHHIALHAARAGCLIEDRRAVRGLEEHRDHVLITTDRGAALKARFAILACGAHSILTRRLKSAVRASSWATASLIVIVPPPATMEHYGSKVHVDFSFIPGGYAGIIPKKDSLALCLYHRKLSSREYLGRKTGEFRRMLGLEGETGRLETEVFESYDEHGILNTGRVMLLGDAGSLVDPLSGEGIRHALKSGLIASEVLAEALNGREDIGDYARRVRTEIGAELRLAGHFTWIAHAFPAVTYGGLINVSEEAGEVLNGNLSYAALLERLKKRLWRKLGRAFRLSGDVT